MNGAVQNSLFEIGVEHQHRNAWVEAAKAFERAAAPRARARDYVRQYPRRGDRFDRLHRLAFVRSMICGGEARQVYEEMAELDPLVAAWWDQIGSKQLDAAARSTSSARLWELIDGGELLASDKNAYSLISRVKDPCIFPPAWWLLAYIRLYRQGWPRAAYAAKEYAAAVVRLTSSTATNLCADQIAEVATAIGDSGDYAAAQSYISSMTTIDGGSCVATRDLIELAAGFSALDGEIGAARATWSGNIGLDSRYQSLIKGKSVAIVAPGNTNALHGDEIDSFDLVVRTNFRSHGVIANRAKNIGTRTDISYYNGNFEPDNRGEILAALRESPISFVVLRFDDDAYVHYEDVLPVRVSQLLNPYYRMNSYAVPKIVYDLLRFSPSRVKIFNADFFLGKTAHYSGYLDYDIKIAQSFLQHDVLRNFRLLKRWFDLGLIEVDNTLAEILKCSEGQILTRIAQKIAGGVTS